MAYQRYDDLRVWQESARLAEGAFQLTEQPIFKGCFSLRDQLERSVVSLAGQIAASHDRQGADRVAMILEARRTVAELRSLLSLLERRPGLANQRGALSELQGAAEICARQLWGWADAIQNPGARANRARSGGDGGRAEDRPLGASGGDELGAGAERGGDRQGARRPARP